MVGFKIVGFKHEITKFEVIGDEIHIKTDIIAEDILAGTEDIIDTKNTVMKVATVKIDFHDMLTAMQFPYENKWSAMKEFEKMLEEHRK